MKNEMNVNNSVALCFTARAFHDFITENTVPNMLRKWCFKHTVCWQRRLARANKSHV